MSSEEPIFTGPRYADESQRKSVPQEDEWN